MLNGDVTSLVTQLFKEMPHQMGLPAVQNTSRLFPDADILAGFSNWPSDGLLLGMAADGLPVLLRLRNPRAGSILITGDRSSGLTSFLKTLVRTSHLLALPRGTRYVLLTDTPNRFYDIDPFSHSLEVYPVYQDAAIELVNEISWRIQFQEVSRPVVFMIDGFETALKMGKQAQNNLVNILSNGPRALVRPLVTMRFEMALRLPYWLEFFETSIYGHINSPEAMKALVRHPDAPLDELIPGVEFCLRQQSRWQKFRLPGLTD